jgi:hypothetical protein
MKFLIVFSCYQISTFTNSVGKFLEATCMPTSGNQKHYNFDNLVGIYYILLWCNMHNICFILVI